MRPSQCFLYVTACSFHSATESGIRSNIVEFLKTFLVIFHLEMIESVEYANSNINFTCLQNYGMGFTSPFRGEVAQLLGAGE